MLTRLQSTGHSNAICPWITRRRRRPHPCCVDTCQSVLGSACCRSLATWSGRYSRWRTSAPNGCRYRMLTTRRPGQMSKLVCDANLSPWVEPILRDLSVLYAAGFIHGETLGEVVRLLVRDGVRVGPIRVE